MPDDTTFHLDPVAPFRLDLTVWVLRRRPDNLVDRWNGRIYRRVLAPNGHEPFEVTVSQSGPQESPRLAVSVGNQPANREITDSVITAVEYLLGIGLDLSDFYRRAESDGTLKPLAEQFCGFKPPRFLSLFEALVNAMSCQQLTLTVGIRLLNRLVTAYGPALRTEEGEFHAFPRPQDLANADVEELRKMGFSYQKARYITGLARSITSNQLDAADVERLGDEKAVDRLRSLRGVGRWTAEYALLRGLGRMEVFPGDDVGARNNLQRWLGLREVMDYNKVRQALESWQPYAGLIYFHLLLKSLVEKGLIVE